MELAFYSSEGWESWGLSGKPTIPEGMAFLVDDDLRFEDGDGVRATAVANEWLRLRPMENCSAPSSWGTYARILRDWIVAAQLHEVEVFDTRDRLKGLLSTYAVDRASGDPKQRLGAVTWNQHMSVLGMFYRWAMAEQYATAVPFTYQQAVISYLSMERMLACEGSAWGPPKGWGAPLFVSEMDSRGGRINGRRVQWHTLRPAERRRLVAPDGGSMLLAVRSDGGPFTAWSTVFERTARRIRERFEPRFPHVHPHCCRHTFAMATMERLVAGFYEQAARLSAAGSDGDAALSHYLTTTEPLLVLRDLLGHSSVLTTEKYLNPRELHLPGAKPQVAWPRREKEGLHSRSELAS
ncbi:hypothetical protein ACWGDS_25315 [Streptomyces sp. NPDC055059]|uniref:hypothetical protein n=1 Tax=Streptomyces sp. NPDC127172 TaxID=3345382 RepID=UPI0036296C30